VRKKHSYYRPLMRLLKAAMLLSLAAWLIGWRQSYRLPAGLELLPDLQQDPVQAPVREGAFEFDYAGHTYVVEPLANYELWGLVVTHNDTRGIGDIYHDGKSVDIRDLCVVWGDNADIEFLRNFSFWSNSWTCHIKTSSRRAFSEFNQLQLSNNHLLSPHSSVRRKILASSVGDQVHIKGQLVNYHRKGSADMRRKTSLTRSDTGNGACEVVFVDSFELLAAGNRGWRQARDIGRLAFLLSLVCAVMFFVLDAYRR